MSANHLNFNGNTGTVKSPASVNLRERFGKRYRVTFEESYCSQYGDQARIDDAWFQVIASRLGHVFPFSDSLLAASTVARGPLARRLADLPFCRIWQDADDGITVVFPVDQFDIVASMLRLPKRRQLTEAQLKALAEHGAAHRFRSTAKPADTTGEAAA